MPTKPVTYKGWLIAREGTGYRFSIDLTASRTLSFTAPSFEEAVAQIDRIIESALHPTNA